MDGCGDCYYEKERIYASFLGGHERLQNNLCHFLLIELECHLCLCILAVIEIFIAFLPLRD